MWYLFTTLAVLLCQAEATWFPESCDEVNAKLQLVTNVPAETITASESHAWYVLLRYPIGMGANLTCERIQMQHTQNNQLLFTKWAFLGDTTLKVPTLTQPWEQYGNFTILDNTYDKSQNGLVILKVLYLDLNLVIVAVCFKPVDRTDGSEIGAWISTSNTVLSSDQQEIAKTIFANNDLDFSALQNTPYTPQCSTLNDTTLA